MCTEAIVRTTERYCIMPKMRRLLAIFSFLKDDFRVQRGLPEYPSSTRERVGVVLKSIYGHVAASATAAKDAEKTIVGRMLWL
jgi:hypothetical protein